MTKLKEHFIPFCIFVFSLTLRLALISKGPYHLDCLLLAIKAQETLNTFQLQTVFGPGYPLTVISGALFIFFSRLFSIHDPVIAVNMMSVDYSAAAVLIYYYLFRRLFGGRVAVIGALIFSLSPIFLGISVFGNSHAPSLFFLLLSIYLLIESQSRPLPRLASYAAISLGLMGACRIQDMILMAIPITLLYSYPPLEMKRPAPPGPKENNFKNFIIFWVIAAGTAAVFHIPYFLSPKKDFYFDQLSTFTRLGLWENFSGFYYPSFKFCFKFLIKNFSIFGLLTAWAGLGLMTLREPKKVLFLIFWLVVPLFFYGNILTTAPRYLILSSIPLTIAFAYSMELLLKAPGRLQRSIALVILVFIFVKFSTTIFPALMFRHHYALLPDYARWVEKHTERNALIIHQDADLFIEYYGHRKTLKRPSSLFPYTNDELFKFKEKLDALLKGGVPVYITNTGIWGYNSKQQFSQFLDNYYNPVFVGQALSEDWHQGELHRHIGYDKLFRIQLK